MPLRIQVALLFTVLAGSTFSAAHADVHKDNRIGYQLSVPRGWKQIPLKMDEQWIVAKYVSDKVDRYVENQYGWSWEHAPEVRVIAFVDQLIYQSDLDDGDDEEEDEEEKGESKGDGQSESKVKLRRVFRDYKDYLKGTYPSGFYVSAEEDISHKDMPVTCIEVKVENRLGYGHKRLITWVYDTDIAHVAVQFEVLEDSYKEHRSKINRTLKSYKPIERTVPLDMFDWKSGYLSYYDLKKLSPAERAERRKAEQSRHWERLCREIPDDWTAKEIDGVKVLNHVDDRFAKKVVTRVNAVAGWLEKAFPGVGADEYARMPIVRICDDWEEENEFRSGTDGWSVQGTELVTNKNKFGSTSVKWEYVNRRTLQVWFLDRNREVWLGLPGWLRTGIYEVVEAASVKGSKLKFDVGNTERTWLQRTSRDGSPIGLRELMLMTRGDYSAHAKRKDWKAWAQSVALARFLIDGAGAKGKYKDTLNDYLQSLSAVLADIDEERKESGKLKRPSSEEEEEEYFKKLREDLEQRERRIIEEVFNRTFGPWSDSKWKSFERTYLRTVK